MKRIFPFFFLIVLMSFSWERHDEGMYPLSYLSKLDLQQAGLELDPSEIYAEDGNSLINALVRLGGCTGSFISEQGLIITNHHCVFSAVASLSTPENNYLENGFYAPTNQEELKTSLPCRITLSSRDVSAEVLEGVDAIQDALKKQERISQNIKAVIASEQEQYPEVKVDVSEMLVGKDYTLFHYKELNDVRIVYVPPKSIGKFGGETDNWEWPRHNGDFSIVRAYENGEPYHPKRHLEVNPAGTKEGDFTFILGYPGTTYRNQPAQYLEYQQRYILPIISDWFDYRIAAIEEFAGNDVAKQLRYSGTLASLNNTSKNFKGKLQGLRRTNIMDMARERQRTLKDFAVYNPAYADYVPLFDQVEELHQEKFTLVTDLIYMSNTLNVSKVASAASAMAMAQEAMNGMDKAQKEAYVQEQLEGLQKSLHPFLHMGEEGALEEQLLAELIYRLSQSRLPDVQAAVGQPFLGKDRAAIGEELHKLLQARIWRDQERSASKFESNPRKYLESKDPLISLMGRISAQLQIVSTAFGNINAQIDAIIPRLNDLEQARNPESYIPDANSTLRFTYGYVKGYEPEDGIYFHPYTTINGILEKAEGTSTPDYMLSDRILQKLKQTEAADVLRHPENASVVVAFLYNMDTTGGNSGSPVMDSKGRLVGVNFDRAYSATINDYAWNEGYSRSIGVDIRYVLYNMKYFGGADEVLAEIGVEL